VSAAVVVTETNTVVATEETVSVATVGCILAPLANMAHPIYRAMAAGTISTIYALRNGGTDATVNVRKNGALVLRSSDLQLVTPDAWTSFGALQNNTVAIGDTIEVQVVTLGGTVTQLAFQIEFA
jgi:hypothetical protein